MCLDSEGGNMEGMSIADALAIRNNGDGYGMGGSWLWTVIVIILLCGGGFGGGYGYRGGAFDGVAQGISNEFLFSNLNSGIEQTRNSVLTTQNGIADLGYALNTNYGNIRYEMAQNINAVNGNIAGLRSEMQSGFCCLGNTMHNETQRVIDLINANTQQCLRDQLADEKLAKSQLLQNAYLVEKLTPAPTTP